VGKDIIESMKVISKTGIVVGDSRYNLKAFKGITLITPNESEAYQLTGLDEERPIEEAGKKILDSMQLEALLITRGNKGMALFLKNGVSAIFPFQEQTM
jgi:bifunctional ADP-heptose synthase (sugar kinase/adenylyltransferase)